MVPSTKNPRYFCEEANISSLLNENDFRDKRRPLDYAEEQACREQKPEEFGGHRWNESLQNFKILHKETIRSDADTSLHNFSGSISCTHEFSSGQATWTQEICVLKCHFSQDEKLHIYL